MIPVDSLSLLAADPEPRFVEIAKHQKEYVTLPALIYQDGRVLTEWSFTEEEHRLCYKRLSGAAYSGSNQWAWAQAQPEDQHRLAGRRQS